jgi:hypothetical protein
LVPIRFEIEDLSVQKLQQTNDLAPNLLVENQQAERQFGNIERDVWLNENEPYMKMILKTKILENFFAKFDNFEILTWLFSL